ncbi:MAG: hypothetical protein MZW92_37880 [Comamonadaceae bacterium]|nr:hypothetical protein [Comamonadaceae bacterium]
MLDEQLRRELGGARRAPSHRHRRRDAGRGAGRRRARWRDAAPPRRGGGAGRVRCPRCPSAEPGDPARPPARPAAAGRTAQSAGPGAGWPPLPLRRVRALPRTGGGGPPCSRRWSAPLCRARLWH